MGLSNNAKYKATSHFKDRLSERFDIQRSKWHDFMRKVYSTLQKDVRKSALASPREVHYSPQYECYVVVDPANFKLITIYSNEEIFENKLIFEHIQEQIAKAEALETAQSQTELDQTACEVLVDGEYVQAKELNQVLIEDDYADAEEVVFEGFDEESEDFAKDEEPKELVVKDFSLELAEEAIDPELEEEPYNEDPYEELRQKFLLEQEELLKKQEYYYAKQVISDNAQVFDNFIKAYNRILNGSASRANRNYLHDLYELHKDIDAILNQSNVRW